MTTTRPASSAPLAGTGLLLVLFTAAVSGVSTFVNAYAVKGTSSDAFVTVRNLAVVALLVPFAAVLGRRGIPRLRRVDLARLVVIGVFGGGIPFLLFFHGLALAAAGGGAATATFGYRTLFLMATVLGVVVLRERFHPRVFLAALAILAGNALLLSFSTPIWTDGTGYVLVATALWAGEYTLSKRALRDLPSWTVAVGRMGFGAVFLSAYLGATAQWSVVARFSPTDWQWVGVSALFLLAFVLLWYSGLRYVDLGVATSVLVLGFPITWALSVAFQGAPFTGAAIAGAVIVVLGVGVVVGRSLLREGWAALASLWRRPSAAPAP